MKRKYDLKIDVIEKKFGFYEWNKPSFYINKKDKRYKHFQKMKKETGIYPDEMWSLDHAIALFIVPRLKLFKKHIKNFPCHPANLENTEQWLEIIDKMIFAFEDAMNDIFIEDEKKRKEYEKKVEEGLNLFAEYFRGLWY